MRVLAVQVAILLLCMALIPLGALSDGGIDPKVPTGLYESGKPHPVVTFANVTVERGQQVTLEVDVTYPGLVSAIEVSAKLTIYGLGMYDEELDLNDIQGSLPTFQASGGNGTVGFGNVWEEDGSVSSTDPFELRPVVTVHADSDYGYYRCSVLLTFEDGKTAKSRGLFTPVEWKDNLEAVRQDEDPEGATFLVSEGGFAVVPPHFDYVSRPNRVPDFGNFTTPVIRPGEKGTYNFTVTNRYNLSITDVTVVVEFYMWATIEEAKPIGDLGGPVPAIVGEGGPKKTTALGEIATGDHKAVVLEIVTERDTPKGTYFVRHSITFKYDGAQFNMSSRGFFTRDQWEGFDYSNLYYQLDSAGIVPDSSFSVKDPVPLWPLATLITLCVLLGALAVVFYLAEEHGDQYPRLKKGLQYWSGRWEQRKRLMQQRLDDIRADQEAEDGEDDRDLT